MLAEEQQRPRRGRRRVIARMVPPGPETFQHWLKRQGYEGIDHRTAECVGIHAVKKATRFEALEPIRQAVKENLGFFSAGAA